MPSTYGTSGAYDTKRSQVSRPEIAHDKDWIPLVETETVVESETVVAKGGGHGEEDDIVSKPLPVGVAVSSNDANEKKWPLGGANRTSGTWNEPASWESSRAAHTRRATLERRNSAGGRWKVSMDI
jgi:hypothetical protein